MTQTARPLSSTGPDLDLERYMNSRYVNGGRVWPNWDCYGMTRQGFIDWYGLALPMLDGLDARSAVGKSRHHETITAAYLQPAEPAHGVLVAQVVGRVCQHVGLVIELAGNLYVMETDEPTGPRIISLSEFVEERIYVRYYAPA